MTRSGGISVARRTTRNLATILLDQRAECFPDARALVWDGGSWSVAQLRERTLRMAAVFAARGVGFGDVVLLRIARMYEAATAWHRRRPTLA